MRMMTTTSPYADAAAHYWDNGWRSILPLPAHAKWPPPEGWTGYNADTPSYADIHTWIDQHPHGNIALRLPPGIIGVDVDNYGDKPGAATLTEYTDRHGPLPASWLSTSRDDGISGIRLYRVPDDTRLITAIPGIEIIQHFHRYVVAAPSIHPDTGQPYQWIDERTGHIGGTPPISDIPPLPDTWLTALTSHTTPTTKDTDADLADILNQMPPGPACHHIERAVGKIVADESRHDAYNRAVLAIAAHGRRGCPGAATTLKRLRAIFTAEIADRANAIEAAAEWRRNLTGALQIVAGEPAGAGCPDDLDWIPDTPTTPGEPKPAAALTGGVWDYRINWPDLLDQPPTDTDWMIEGLLEKGRLVAIYSAPKAGKSLVTLDIAASIALGKPCLGTPADRPRHVLYLDFEMTRDEVADRVRDYGHDDSAGLDEHLHYLSLPSLPPLDSPEGGRALAAAAAECGAELVIIDTTSRTIKGGENDSDTWHAWYRHSGIPLKQLGCTVIRLDHQGKDKDRGQRGSSAKVSDVDLVLRLVRIRETEIILKREEARQAHYVEQMHITVDEVDGHTRHVIGADLYADTIVLDLVARAEESELPADAGRAAFQAMAKMYGIKASRRQCDRAAQVRKAASRGAK